ncbi:UDP-glucose dehydrogenase family protein [[Eubacterium] cellulosolvens]
MKKKVAVLGLGYVGLTMAAFLAERGIETLGFDSDKKKLAVIKSGKSPIHEPNLEGLVSKGLKSGELKLIENLDDVVKETHIAFITVGTPSNPDGSINLEQINTISESMGKSLRKVEEYYLIAVRSTVIPKTCERIIIPTIEESSGKKCGKSFGLCMNPEFLQEGSSVKDMRKPNRIVIGEFDDKSGSLLEDFYRSVYSDEFPSLLRTNLSNAELIKYANNAFLATKISFINSIANLCEKIPGSDIEAVAKGIGLDPRISPKFLKAGLGWGGSCIPKDLKALLSFAKELGIEMPVIKGALEINKFQPIWAINKAKKTLGSLKGKQIAILGLAFKPNTDDIRDAVSIRIIDGLLQEGAFIRAYDPEAMDNFRRKFGEKIIFSSSIEECIEDAECCIIVTEWDEFSKIGPEVFKAKMKRPLIIDGRRLFNNIEFSKKVEYLAVGIGKKLAYAQ